MTLLERIRDTFAPRQQTKQAGHYLMFWPRWREGQPEWQLTDLSTYVEEGFEINAIIYAAIMFKVRAAYGAALRAYEGTRDEPELLDYDHPLSRLVDRPNRFQSFGELQSEMLTFFNLMGNAYVWYRRQRGSEYPAAFYNLRPDWVRHIYQKQELKGYVYVPSGVAIEDGTPLLVEDVMHVRLPNPADPYAGMGKGLSPISALARSADVDNAATEFLKVFFDSGAMPRYLLSVDAPLSQAIIDEATEAWMDRYGGRDNWIKPMVQGRGATAQRLSATFDELAMDKIDARNENRTAMCFGVPLTLIEGQPALVQSTYSNKQQDYKMFLETTLLPELSMFETEWRYYLRFADGREFAQYDFERVPGFIDETEHIARVKDAWDGAAATRAEYRRALGLPATDADDVYKLTYTTVMVPASAQATAPTTERGAGSAGEEGAGKALLPGGNGQLKTYLADEYKATIRRMIDVKAETWEPQARRAARAAFEHDRREVLAIVGAAQKSAYTEAKSVAWSLVAQQVIDYLRTASKDTWRSTFAPVLAAVVVDQGEQLNTLFGMQFDVRNLLAEDWFADYRMRFTDPISDTSQETLHKVFDRALAEGWSVPKMQRAIDGVFDQWIQGGVSSEDLAFALDRLPPYRTEMIARTETMRASNAGANALYGHWGAPRKEWLSTADDRTRETHRVGASWGQGPLVVGIDETFDIGGVQMRYPGDENAPLEEVVNCRCSVLPAGL